ncbi:MAG: multi-sensor signal transduction histidine kinase [Pedosphaera sp.]|nr:multi-sensor signal transduction histidine kinase [Pedosphaera sp.]
MELEDFIDQFRVLFQCNPLPMWVWDAETLSFLAVNDAVLELYGYSREEMLRMTVLDIRPPEDIPRLKEVLAALPPNAVMTESGEWRHVKRDGTLIYAEIRSQPVVFHGRAARLVMVTDVTARKEAEQALRQSEARLNEAQHLAGLGSFEWNIAGRTTSYSDELFRMFGFPPQGVPFDIPQVVSAVHPEDRAMMGQLLTDLVKNPKSFQCNFRIVLPGGQVRYLHGQGELSFDAEGKPLKMTGTTQDVTERMLAEENRLRNAKLLAANQELEAFSYSVSHDLRTPLRSIDAFGKLLEEEYGERLDENGRSYLDLILRGTQRMNQLIDDLLEFSRVTSTEINHMDVDLSGMVQGILGELRRAEPERNVEIRVSPGLTAHADPRLVRIALENLLRNAWKFTGKTPAARIEFGVERREGEAIYHVRDNGAGFDMVYVGRLFGVFQRLHSEREFSGTGIGLAIVQRIINRHGGRVWAEGAVNKGATFYFTLPE